MITENDDELSFVAGDLVDFSFGGSQDLIAFSTAGTGQFMQHVTVPDESPWECVEP